MATVNDLPQRYTIIDTLGEGGNGIVYRVRDAERDEEIALKVLTRFSPEEASCLVEEFRTLSALSHEHLVSVHDLDRLADGTPFFTMEIVEGQPLDRFLACDKNPKTVPVLMLQTLRALAFLHERNILHGDIKPENLLVDNLDGVPQLTLLDFGLVRRTGRTTDSVSGTIRFLAPEIMRGEAYTPATDVYALGMTLVESLTGRETPVATEIGENWLLRAETETKRTLLLKGTPRHAALARFILRLCDPDPATRTSDCAELADRLALLTGEADPIANPIPEGLFVDREETIAQIEDAQFSEQSARNLVILLGERGIGRKAVMREIRRRAQLEGWNTLSLIDAGGEFLSLSAFIEHLFNALPENEFTALQTELDQASAEIREKTGAARDSLFYDIVARAVDELAKERRLAIFLPDIDDAPREFLPFVAHLARELSILDSTARLIVSVQLDTSTRSVHLAELSASEQTIPVEVPPFDRDTLINYLSALSLDDVFSEREITRLEKAASGIPARIRAALLRCIREEALVPEEGRWRLDRERFQAIDLEADLESKADIGSISESTVELLAAIHLWHGPVPIEMLELTALDLDIPFASSLRELKDMGIAVLDERDSISLHRSVDETSIVDRLGTESIVNIAETMLRIADERQIALASATRFTLSLHANMEKKAIAAGLEHADQLRSRHDLFEAAGVLKSVIPMAETLGDKKSSIDILNRLAQIEFLLGHTDETLAHYREVARLSADNDVRFYALLETGRILSNYTGDSEEGLRHQKSALALARKMGSNILKIKALLRLADHPDSDTTACMKEALSLPIEGDMDIRAEVISYSLYYSRIYGNLEATDAILSEAHELIDKVSDSARLIIADHLANYYLFRGNYDAAIKSIKIVQKDTKRTNSWLKYSKSLGILGGCYYVKGQFAQMINTLMESLFIAKRLNDILSIMVISANIMLAYLKTSQYGEVLELIDRIISLREYQDMSRKSPHITQKIAHFYLLLGENHREAFEATRAEAEEKSRAIGQNITLGHCRMLAGRDKLQQLRFDDALPLLDEALELFEKTGDRDDIVEALSWRVLALAELGEADEAGAAAERAASIYDEIKCEYLLPHLGLARGVAAESDPGAAIAILEEALRSSEEMQTAETTWMIQREIARLHLATGDIPRAGRFYKDAVETIKGITETIPDEETKLSYLAVPLRRRIFDEIKELKRSLA